MSEQQVEDPPQVLLLPTLGVPAVGRPAQLALWHTAAGELVVVAYSDIAALVAAAGDCQPWVALGTAELLEALVGTPVQRVLLDAPLPREATDA